MLAPCYPSDYNGILAGAPALYIPILMIAHWQGKMIMHALKTYPKPCELEYLTRGAIEEYDELDGIKDEVISNETACNFDPFALSNPAMRRRRPLHRNGPHLLRGLAHRVQSISGAAQITAPSKPSGTSPRTPRP